MYQSNVFNIVKYPKKYDIPHKKDIPIKVWHTFAIFTLTIMTNHWKWDFDIWHTITILTYLHYCDIPLLFWHTFTIVTYLHYCDIPLEVWHYFNSVTFPKLCDLL